MIFSLLSNDRRRRNESQNFISTLKPTFYFEGDKALQQFVWAGCGFSVLGVTQIQTGQGPEQPAPVLLLWALWTQWYPEMSSNLSCSVTLKFRNVTIYLPKSLKKYHVAAYWDTNNRLTSTASLDHSHKDAAPALNQWTWRIFFFPS